MASYMDFWSQNTGINFRRKYTKRHRHNISSDRPCTPVTLRPSIDTSTGIISIRYSDPDDSPISNPSTLQSSGSSERSFYIESSPTPEDSSERSFYIESSPAPEDSSSDKSTTRPSLPKRSASRRVVFCPTSALVSAPVEQERSLTPPATSTDEGSRPPPIPPKSPYRASRAMIRLHRQMAEMSEDQPETNDEHMIYELEG